MTLPQSAPLSSHETALRLYEAGFSVVPVPHRQKKPSVTWKSFQACRATRAEIDAWFRGEVGVGVVTGQSSDGLVVIDVDPRKGGSLDALGELPPTVRVATGGGGYHLWFRSPHKIGNRTNLLPGVDVRGEGGFVVAPPTHHASGQPYRWDWAPWVLPVAELPERLVRLLLPSKSATKHGPQRRNSRVVEDSGAPILEGCRNNTLTRIAGSLRSKGLSENQIFTELAQHNAARCQPPLDNAELHTIAKSIARYPAAQSAIASLLSTFEAAVWAFYEQGRLTDGAALVALSLCGKAHELQRAEFPIAERELAERAVLAPSTVHEALQRLAEQGFLRQAAPNRFGDCSTWTLLRPSAEHSLPLGEEEGRILLHSSLSFSAKRIWVRLHRGPATSRRLAGDLSMPERTVSRALKRLEESSGASRDGHVWCWQPLDVDEGAILARRRQLAERNAADRTVFRAREPQLTHGEKPTTGKPFGMAAGEDASGPDGDVSASAGSSGEGLRRLAAEKHPDESGSFGLDCSHDSHSSVLEGLPRGA